MIVCGFGRIGVMLAKDLVAGGADFVVLERNEARLNQARELGYLCWQGDATDETAHFFGAEKGRGTMPHALIGYAGSTVRAAEMVVISPNDPLLNLGKFAVEGPSGKMTNADIDRMLYGGP